MGNLDRIGVAVVVVLLSVIIVVSFLAGNDGERDAPPTNDRSGETASAETDSGGSGGGGTELASRFDSRRNLGERVLGMGEQEQPSTPPIKDEADEGELLIIGGDDPEGDVVAKEKEEPAPKEDAEPVGVGTYPRKVKLGDGENLWVLAEREYGPRLGPNMIAAIEKANGIKDARSLKNGMEILLPAPKEGLSPKTAKPKEEAPEVAEKPSKPKAAEPDTTPAGFFPPFDPNAGRGVAPAAEGKTTLVSQTDDPNTHRVRSGETLGHIAIERLGSTRFVKSIMTLNGITDPNKIREGQVLKLPVLEN